MKTHNRVVCFFACCFCLAVGPGATFAQVDISAGLIIQRADGIRFSSSSDPFNVPNSFLRGYFKQHTGQLRISHLDPKTGEERQLVTTPNLASLAARLSPDGRYLAYGTETAEQARLHVRDLSNNSEAVCAIAQPSIRACTWSPDGQYIAIQSAMNARPTQPQMDVTLYRLRRAAPTLLLEVARPMQRTNHLPAFSPAGDQIAFCDGFGDIRIERFSPEDVLASAEAAPLHNLSDPKIRFWDPQWSPNGKRLLLVGAASPDQVELFVASMEADDEDFLKPVRLGSRRVTAAFGKSDFPPLGFAAWAPDSEQIAYIADRRVYTDYSRATYDMFLHNLTCGQTTELTTEGRLPPPRSLNSYAARWSPDGKKIAFVQMPKGASLGLFVPPPNAYGNPIPLELWTADVETKSPKLEQVTNRFADVVLDWR